MPPVYHDHKRLQPLSKSDLKSDHYKSQTNSNNKPKALDVKKKSIDNYSYLKQFLEPLFNIYDKENHKSIQQLIQQKDTIITKGRNSNAAQHSQYVEDTNFLKKQSKKIQDIFNESKFKSKYNIGNLKKGPTSGTVNRYI